jgi:type IV secretory pathway TrbD component
MPDNTSHESPAEIATVQYELTDDIACRLAIDLLEWRIAQGSGHLSALGGIRPIVVLSGVAVQILIAIAAVRHWIVTKLLVVIGVVVVAILLWKAMFYGLPPVGRWYVCRNAIRHARRLSHRRIRWLLYEDRLETESASTRRKIAWSEVSQMIPCGQSIVLILRSGVDLAVPASALSADAQFLIARRIVSPRDVQALLCSKFK